MPDDAALVTAFLADRHVTCPACGYDLCGVDGVRCPECGVDVDLRLVDRGDSVKGFGLPCALAGISMITYAVIALGVRSSLPTVFVFMGAPFWPAMLSRYSTWWWWFENAIVLMALPIGLWLIVLSRRVSAPSEGWRRYRTAFFWLAVYVAACAAMNAVQGLMEAVGWT